MALTLFSVNLGCVGGEVDPLMSVTSGLDLEGNSALTFYNQHSTNAETEMCLKRLSLPEAKQYHIVCKSEKAQRVRAVANCTTAGPAGKIVDTLIMQCQYSCYQTYAYRHVLNEAQLSDTYIYMYI